jgi:hypothetical protein
MSLPPNLPHQSPLTPSTPAQLDCTELHNLAKLTENDVRRIRSLKGIVQQKQLAEEYGVTPPAISAIWRRTTWRDVV